MAKGKVEIVAADHIRISGPDPALSESLSRTVLPVVEKVSSGLIRAVEPILQEYQQDVADALDQQIRRAFPGIGRAEGENAKGDTEEDSQGTRRQEQPTQAQSHANQESGQSDVPVSRRDESTAKEEGGGDSPAAKVAVTSNQPSGGKPMATETAQSDNTTKDDETQDRPEQRKRNRDRSANGQAQRRSSGQRDGGQSERGQSPTYYYDPRSAARAGLVHLATAWKESGSTYQAIHAYMEVLTRYPQTGAAAAATEGLVDLANTLEKQGRFYAALEIYHKLEAVL